ncbi:MAG: ATP-binding protein [Candidatus Sumerlaeota bacterium]|nr:ATP-binding protein [Candidatus Sumerlaeota bacterium]
MIDKSINNQTNIHRITVFKLFSQVTSVFVALIGFFVLIGWIFDIPVLKCVIPGMTAMNPTTAVCFILSGLSLFTHGVSTSSNRDAIKWIAKTCAFLLCLIAMTKLISFLDYDLGIDQVLFRDKLEIYTPPNRMAPNTAVNFLLIGISLLILKLETRRGYRPCEFTALVSSLISILALAGYIYGVKRLYGIASYIPMALNTALAFNFIVVGILCLHPDRGMMEIITSDNAGGRMARHLLPTVIGIPIILAWLRLRGEIVFHYYGTEGGVSIMVVSTVIILTAIVWWNARSLNKIDAERKRAEEAIEKLNEELKLRIMQLGIVNKELESFSYSVSHDLRAPLRSIDGFSLALLEDYEDKLDLKGKDFLHRVRTATQNMAVLIDDLLKLSQVTRSEMRLDNVDMSSLAHSIAESLQKSAPERRVTFLIQDGLTAKGDRNLLEMALVNLIENAWNFSSGQLETRIEFGSGEIDGKHAYFVRDNGVGFDMTYVDQLFGAFQRLHSTKEFPGTGIGLATVQRIIHRHGGRVWAEGAVNKGATFYFTL